MYRRRWQSQPLRVLCFVAVRLAISAVIRTAVVLAAIDVTVGWIRYIVGMAFSESLLESTRPRDPDWIISFGNSPNPAAASRVIHGIITGIGLSVKFCSERCIKRCRF